MGRLVNSELILSSQRRARFTDLNISLTLVTACSYITRERVRRGESLPLLFQTHWTRAYRIRLLRCICLVTSGPYLEIYWLEQVMVFCITPDKWCTGVRVIVLVALLNLQPNYRVHSLLAALKVGSIFRPIT